MPDITQRQPAETPPNLEDPASWRLSEVQRFCEYDGEVLDFLANGPIGFKDHPGHWLVTWRSGGKLSNLPNTPVELAGLERRLAIPISEVRERQIIEGHISLREAIAFAEGDHVYELLGADHLAPVQVVRTQPSRLPTNYLPTADLTVQGHLMPSLGPGAEGGALEVRVHLVPGYLATEVPSLSDAGTIQGAFQRYLGWAAAESHRRKSAPEATGLTGSFGPPAWSSLALTRAIPGTLLLIAEARVQDTAQRESLLSALASLKTLARANFGSGEGGTDDGSASPEDDEVRIAVAALVALADVLRSVHISVSIRWRAGESDHCALIGPDATDSVLQARNVLSVATQIQTSVRSATVNVILSNQDAQLIQMTVDPGAGGLQKLLSTLQKQLRSEEGRFVLSLSADQVEKVIRYVQEYGQGGYQDRLRPIYEALYRMGVAFVGIK